MADIIAFDKTALPAVFNKGAVEDNDELTAGVSGGFGIISFRGRVWRVKYKGEEHVITDDSGEPRPSLEVVLLKASKAVSKQFYAKQYEEGDAAEPDCWSADGIVPDPSVMNPVSTSCATCPNNVFGSKITDTGSKAKACSDIRRVAVVPYPDIKNEAFGGPMLLRVPPSGLTEMAAMATKLKASGIPYYGVVVKLSFDLDASYPKLKFTPLRAITDTAEAQTIMELRNSPEVDYIINPPSVAPAATTTASPAQSPQPTPQAEAGSPPDPVQPAAQTETRVPSEQASSSPPSAETPVAEAPADVDALVASLLNEG